MRAPTPQQIVDRFSRLPLRTKLLGVIGVLALPILTLVAFQVSRDLDAVNSNQAALDGLQYIDNGPVVLLKDVQRHRLQTALVASGDSSAKAALAEAADAVERDLAAIAKTEGATAKFGASSTVAIIRDQWGLLKAAGDTASADAVIAAHNRLVDEGIIPLIFAAGNSSKLFQLGDLDAQNTVMGITQGLILETEAESRAGAYGVVAIRTRTAGQPASPLLRGELTAELLEVKTSEAATHRWLAGASAANEEYARKVDPLLKAAEAAAGTFTANVLSLAGDSPQEITTADFLKSLTGTSDANTALYVGAESVVRSDLKAGISGAWTNLLVTLGAGLGALAVATFLAVMIARSITGPIERLVVAADRMSLGELDLTIPAGGAREVRRLAESLARMQLSLRSAIERLRARRAA
ncbi:MAG: HAMP domain-containing protein [Dehalococcoidia bacterium]